MSILLAGTLLATVAAVSTPPDEQWYQWRGPNRDGISKETGLLKKWPDGGPPLLWKNEAVGEGFGTVSVFGDRVFVLGDTGMEGECRLYALDLKDGKQVWSTRVGRPRGKFGNGDPGARSTPTTDGKLVWTLGALGDLVCTTADKGVIKWRVDLAGKDLEGKVGGWKYSESPLLDGDQVVCTPGGSKGAVMAFHKATGKELWRTADLKDRAQYTSLAIAEIGRVRQYIVFTMATVAGIAAKNGQVLWKANRKGKTAICSTPLYGDGIVFVASGYGVGNNAFSVTASGNRFSSKELYSSNEVLRNHHGGMILLDGRVYGLHDDKGLTCVELKTGKVVWQERSVGKGSIAYADGHLIVRGEKKGDVALVEATPEGYKEKGRFTPPSTSKYKKWAHPVVAGGRMYLRDQNVLYCYDVRSK